MVLEHLRERADFSVLELKVVVQIGVPVFMLDDSLYSVLVLQHDETDLRRQIFALLYLPVSQLDQLLIVIGFHDELFDGNKVVVNVFSVDKPNAAVFFLETVQFDPSQLDVPYFLQKPHNLGD